ncbi:MAG: FAD-dependent oxidoreductase [Gammaproteobacteria bacterium]
MTTPQPKIVIVGAGPSGLLTAHYLRLNGYRDVTLLEKLGRVGGLACSITYKGRSFDLGANYITPAYKEIRKLARQLGATTYAERPFIAMKLPEQPGERAKLGSIVTAMRIRKDGSKIPFLSFAWSNLRYIWKRFKLRSVLDTPTFAGIERHPEMTVPMNQWLIDNRLENLHGVFLLPVNLMGFGTVATTPAMYALKFMTLKSYIPMLIKEAPLIGRIARWPRRFTEGFQRLFDRLSWHHDVRFDIDIEQVRRSKDGVQITFREPEQILDEIRMVRRELHADKIILACPLTEDVMSKFMDIDPESQEGKLLDKITSLSYCMTSRHVTGPAFDGRDPLAACYPLPEIGFLPWGVAKQWHDSSFTQFYSRVEPKLPYDDVEEKVQKGVDEMIEMMGGKSEAPDAAWRTFNRFPYFQHVDAEAINAGWFTKLENQQGVNHTHYVGGATNFELIEPIAEYAKNMVATHFPKRKS